MLFLRLFSSPYPCLDSSTRLLAPKPDCGSAVFLSSTATFANPCRHVQSRQLNSCELDVTLICSSDCDDGLRSEGVESRQQGNQTNTTKPPYNIHRWGTNVHWQEEYNVGSKFTFKVRNVQPPLYQPGHPLLISKETRITVQSLQNTTSPVHCVPT